MPRITLKKVWSEFNGAQGGALLKIIQNGWVFKMVVRLMVDPFFGILLSYYC